MMKRNNKKSKKSTYGSIKITLLSGLSVFVILLLTLAVATCFYYFFRRFGIVEKINYKTLMFVDYALVCTVIGFFLSILIIHRPAERMQRLLDAMEQIASGDFSVRLSKSKSHGKMTNKTVEMFNNMAGQLESTETLSHDFINNFSHEFKTPIASINGFAKLLKDENLTIEEKNEYLDIIIQESERLSNLSINILTLSRLEQQTILTNKSQFNLSEQIRIIIGSLYHKWAAKNLEIDFTGEDISIVGNKEMLGQVWVNLLDNAIKFSSEGKQIMLEIKKSENVVIITIQNYGRYLSEKQKNRIFDKFYQGDESHSTNGNGLGLPMVKRIVELHEGSVDVSCSEEPAVTFSVVLPTE